MADVLDAFNVWGELEYLQDLAYELDVFLSRIYGDGMSECPTWIRRRTREMRREHNDKVKRFRSDKVGKEGWSHIDEAVYRIIHAYDCAIDILSVGTTPNVLRGEAADILYENLIFPDEATPAQLMAGVA